MTIRIFHVSDLDSIFILIGAWQVVQNGDGFEVIYWKFLTGAVEENVKPCSGTHSLKIICQNLAYLRRKAACHLLCMSNQTQGWIWSGTMLYSWCKAHSSTWYLADKSKKKKRPGKAKRFLIMRWFWATHKVPKGFFLIMNLCTIF